MFLAVLLTSKEVRAGGSLGSSSQQGDHSSCDRSSTSQPVTQGELVFQSRTVSRHLTQKGGLPDELKDEILDYVWGSRSEEYTKRAEKA